MDSDPLALLDPARGLSRNDLRAGLAAAGRQTLPIALRKSSRRTCEQPMNFSLTDYLRGLSLGRGSADCVVLKSRALCFNCGRCDSESRRLIRSESAVSPRRGGG